MNLFKSICFLGFLLLLAACGYRLAGEDKHPELPFFPELVDGQFQLEALPYEGCEYLGKSHHFYFVDADMDTSKYEDRYLVLLDGRLKEIARIKRQQFVGVKTDGTIYTGQKNLFAYTYPSMKSQKVPILTFDIDSVIKTLPAHEQEKIATDTTIDAHAYRYQLYGDHMKKHLLEGLDSVFHIDRFTVLYYGKKVYGINNRESYVSEFIYDLPQALSAEYIPEGKGEAVAFIEDVVLGNKSMSHRVATSFHPFGLEYYHLILGTDSIKIKVRSDHLGGEGLVQLASPVKGKVLLRETTAGRLYWLTKAGE